MGLKKKTCTVPLSEHDCLFMCILHSDRCTDLVCRYFFRYTISSGQHRVPCDKNKGQELLPTAIRLVAVHGVQELRTGADMRCTGGNNERQEMFMRRGLFRDSS